MCVHVYACTLVRLYICTCTLVRAYVWISYILYISYVSHPFLLRARIFLYDCTQVQVAFTESAKKR